MQLHLLFALYVGPALGLELPQRLFVLAVGHRDAEVAVACHIVVQTVFVQVFRVVVFVSFLLAAAWRLHVMQLFLESSHRARHTLNGVFGVASNSFFLGFFFLGGFNDVLAFFDRVLDQNFISALVDVTKQLIHELSFYLGVDGFLGVSRQLYLQLGFVNVFEPFLFLLPGLGLWLRRRSVFFHFHVHQHFDALLDVVDQSEAVYFLQLLFLGFKLVFVVRIDFFI